MVGNEPISVGKRAAAQAGLLFLLLLSPVGAPLVGWLVVEACGVQWEGEPLRCATPNPALDYFVSFTILPFIWVGPFLAILWNMVAAGIALAMLWLLGRSIWAVTMERL